MEIYNEKQNKLEKLAKEAASIYGLNKSQSVLYNYLDYIEMRKKKEIEIGNYNVFIRNASAYDSADKLLKLIVDLLKESGVINAKKIKYLEEKDFIVKRKIEKQDDVKAEILVLDTRTNISFRYLKESYKRYTKKHPEKIFILIDEDYNNVFFNTELGELFAWTMEIDKMTKDNKIDYINKYLKKNKINIEKNNCFIEEISNEPFWKIRDELFNLIIICKKNKINKLTDEILKKEVNFKYIKDLKISDVNKNKTNGMKQLNKLIGIKEVKKQVEEIINYIDINGKRGKLPMLHMCFEGNPGTGKTTVARIIGEIFKQRKILSNNGQFIEAQRGDLIGRYVGWTAKQTEEIIQKANGGVLLIDEAYSLNPKTSNDSFSSECIATLIKEMEDKRDNLCVILAGYTNEMEELLQANPGFESRIQFKINFPDYTEEELYEIFKIMCKEDNYKLSRNIKEILIEYFSKEKKRENFSNARCVRNIYEKIRFEQANRTIKEKCNNLNIITKNDIKNVIKKTNKAVEEKNKKIKIGFAN